MKHTVTISKKRNRMSSDIQITAMLSNAVGDFSADTFFVAVVVLVEPVTIAMSLSTNFTTVLVMVTVVDTGLIRVLVVTDVSTLVLVVPVVSGTTSADVVVTCTHIYTPHTTYLLT